MNKQNLGIVNDLFEAARKAFFSVPKGDAAASPRGTFTQLKPYDTPVLRRVNSNGTRLATP